MAEITAADVKALRERTGLPMMDCKAALVEAGGDADKAVEILRKKGLQLNAKRSDRETEFGRMGIYASVDGKVGAMIELMCESAPVAKHDEFIELADAIAKQLALGPGAATADELLTQPSPVKPGMTLGQHRDELFNRIREVMNIGRIVRINGPCAGYSHNASTIAGVLAEVTSGPEDAAKDVCMHVAAMRPKALTAQEMDPAIVEKEREILTDVARREGKPENIISKMVEGRLKNFYAETVLLEQPFVKEPKMTVSEFAKSKGFEVRRFVHWELGKA